MIKKGCLLFDWGDTLMRVFPEYKGPMYDWPKLELIPSVKETLSSLNQDWQISLATNAQASDQSDILKAFKRVGADNLLDKIFCFKSIGILKPNPGFFNFIYESFNYQKSDFIMIGDHFKNDIEAATQFGFKGVWFNSSGTNSIETENIKTIFNFSDLPKAINRF